MTTYSSLQSSAITTAMANNNILARSQNEDSHIKCLVRTGLLDTPPSPVFDAITATARLVCGTSMALVSLIDQHRQWFKAKIGINVGETPRNIAFCSHTILQNEMLIVPDATEDKRFHNNPLVTRSPAIRFYAGLPIVVPDGLIIGTLCVADSTPRDGLTDTQLACLTGLTSVITALVLERLADSANRIAI